MLRSKKMITLSGLAAFVLLGIAAIQLPQDKPKNLKVLPKDISSDSLFNIMKTFEHSLGVTCSFCHVVNDSTGYENYASDSIPVKERCRDMMRMTAAINNIYFHKLDMVAVTCMTCHGGRKEPVTASF